MTKLGAKLGIKHREKIRLAHLGKKHTPETKEKMKLAHLGKRHTQETKEKMRGKLGDKSSSWVGDKVGYRAVHTWVNKWKGKAIHCEQCGTTTAKKYEWANIDHKYRRVLEDYSSMCTSCHKKYDISRINGKFANLP